MKKDLYLKNLGWPGAKTKKSGPICKNSKRWKDRLAKL
jgi:hypothetical protein